ncbi:glycosyltransferase family 4 protein [Geomonas oryzae]|uniref:glycosyltransferase family 4 protein n=1 Tax=Geomonas oryzae TaxID=2364273 RepID=UPI00100BA5D6|nr:glycosyltransferase family 4 protein [Geomonas oryzae]
MSSNACACSNKTRVLFISHSPHFYGAEQSLCFLLENIDRTKIEPVVVLPPCPSGFSDTLFQRISKLGIKIYIVDSRLWLDFVAPEVLPPLLFTELSVIGQYLRLITEEQIDVVYTNTITKIAGAIAAEVAGVPHVYHVREVLKDHPLKSPFSDRTTFTLIAALSDHIITNSRYVARQFQGICSPDKITTVYNAVDTSCFETVPPEENRLKRELSLPAEMPLIGIIGTVHRHKNHEELIRALGIMQEHNVPGHLLVIGIKDKEYSDYLETIIDSLNISQRVHFLDFRDDMPQVHHALDLLVVASLGEPFGRTTIEAMAAGKPVIATNAGASPEIIEDMVTGILVPLGAPERMADAIAKLIQDPQLARDMGMRGRERGKQFFSPGSYVNGVTAVIEETASLKKEPAKNLASVLARLIALVSAQEINSFLATATGGPQAAPETSSDAIPTAIALLGEIAWLREQLAQSNCKLSRAVEVSTQMEGMVSALKNSLSWKLTAPLRTISAPLAAKRQKNRN